MMMINKVEKVKGDRQTHIVFWQFFYFKRNHGLRERKLFKVKSTGIVRKLDELGRITLPIELRRNLNISERDPLEIFVDDERIILKKYEPCDIFTGDMNDLIDYHDKKVSKRSIIEMAKMAGLTIQE